VIKWTISVKKTYLYKWRCFSMFDNCVCYGLMAKIIIYRTRHQWLTPVILATQEAEIRRITV
jgi:hypothetical protein